MNQTQSLFLTPRETAKLLGIGLTSFYKILGDPTLAFPRPSRFGPQLVRFNNNEVIAWANQQKVLGNDTPDAIAQTALEGSHD